MGVINNTPQSVVLQQVQEHWQKLFALVLFKLKGTEAVELTKADIERAHEAMHEQGLTLLTHGHFDRLTFQLVDRAAAERLAAHDLTQRGHA